MELVENNNPICIDNFHDENRQVINVNFGKGKIAVGAGIKDFSKVNDGVLPYISFEVLKECANIGDDLINAKEDPINHDYPEVHLNFTDERSIDIVIQSLQNVKDHIIKIKNEMTK